MLYINTQMTILLSNTIVEEDVPLSRFTQTFAIGNLVMMVLTVIEAVIAIIMALYTYKRMANDDSLSKDSIFLDYLSQKRTAATLSIPVAAIAIVEFFFTQDMSMEVVLFDRYSIIMVLFLCLQTFLIFHIKRKAYHKSAYEKIS